MNHLSIRIEGVTRSRLRHWRKLVYGPDRSNWILLTASLLLASVYSFSYPGRISIAIPASSIPALGTAESRQVTVTGKVANLRVRDISLVVDGFPRRLDVNDGAFQSMLDLGPGT